MWSITSLSFICVLRVFRASALLNQNIRTRKNLAVYETKHGYHAVENTSVDGTVACHASRILIDNPDIFGSFWSNISSESANIRISCLHEHEAPKLEEVLK